MLTILLISWNVGSICLGCEYSIGKMFNLILNSHSVVANGYCGQSSVNIKLLKMNNTQFSGQIPSSSVTMGQLFDKTVDKLMKDSGFRSSVESNKTTQSWGASFSSSYTPSTSKVPSQRKSLRFWWSLFVSLILTTVLLSTVLLYLRQLDLALLVKDKKKGICLPEF